MMFVFFLCVCVCVFYVGLQEQMTKNSKIAAKIENCCYFGQISNEKKHVLNFGKELILQFMEVF